MHAEPLSRRELAAGIVLFAAVLVFCLLCFVGAFTVARWIWETA